MSRDLDNHRNGQCHRCQKWKFHFEFYGCLKVKKILRQGMLNDNFISLRSKRSDPFPCERSAMCRVRAKILVARTLRLHGNACYAGYNFIHTDLFLKPYIYIFMEEGSRLVACAIGKAREASAKGERFASRAPQSTLVSNLLSPPKHVNSDWVRV